MNEEEASINPAFWEELGLNQNDLDHVSSSPKIETKPPSLTEQFLINQTRNLVEQNIPTTPEEKCGTLAGPITTVEETKKIPAQNNEPEDAIILESSDPQIKEAEKKGGLFRKNPIRTLKNNIARAQTLAYVKGKNTGRFFSNIFRKKGKKKEYIPTPERVDWN